MERELKITTAEVTIQLVVVDGKKMTKAVFLQAQEEDAFNDDVQFIGDTHLGYVVDGAERWLLWVKNGELRRYRLSHLEHTSRGPDRIAEIEDAQRQLGRRFTYSPEEKMKALENKSAADAFLEKMAGRQLYIAI